MKKELGTASIVSAIALLALTIYLGYWVKQEDFLWLMGGLVPFFIIYVRICQQANISQLYFYLGLGLLLRFVLLFALPGLSDDLYRFIWDGRLLVNGINPFDHLPAYYIEEQIAVPGLSEELFQRLNSPEYFTIYPPVAQFTFWVACWLSPNSIWGSAVLMKIFLFAAECGSCWLLLQLLRHFQLPVTNVLWYALNPMIILEVMGNLHFEGVMIFFLLWAYWLLVKNKIYISAVLLALSIASKLLPLLFLPFLIRRLGWKKSFLYFSIIGGVVVLLFLPMLNEAFLQNFGSSLDLYFRKFEFNASLYYIFRWLGYQASGFNMIAQIGPGLALITFSVIMTTALIEQGNDWLSWAPLMLLAIMVYLLGTTTVHPWYTALPLVLCLFTPFRFPIWWTGLIMLTYVNYSYPVYQENLWVVVVEYVGVLVLGWYSSKQF